MNMFLYRLSDGELLVPGCWLAKWLPCFEPKTCDPLVTIHLFLSFACLKGVGAAQRKCQGQKSSPKNET